MRTRFRLLPTVLICLAALVLVSAGSILALHLVTSKTVVSDLVVRVVRQNLRGLELALRGYLDPARHGAESIAEGMRSGALRFDDRDRLAEFAVGSLASAPQFSGLLISAAGGPTLRLTRDPSGKVEQSWLGAAAAARIRQGERRKEPFWGPPIYSRQLDQTVLNLRMPVWQDEDYLGFVGVGISTQALSQLAIALSNPPRSTVFILYGRDHVLAHSSLSSQANVVSADRPLPAIDQVGDPVIAGLENAQTFRRAAARPTGDVDIRRVDVADTGYVAITKPVFGYGDAPLIIGAYSAAADVNAPFRSMARASVIGIALLIAAMILAYVISRTITRPVRRTSAGTAAIAALDFDDIAPLPPSRIKEIDDLATSFNAMLIGLKSFARYVPRALVNRLIRDNRVGAGTEERDLTVMFTDIVGFTSICEGKNPAEVAEFINHHLTIVSDCIEREGGTIDKYIGDAVMAFWGAPEYMADAPARAARAAIAIRHAVVADNDRRIAAGLPPVRIRIGIHSGPLIVGDIGAPNRINYTVVGDVVNAAQRLEGLGAEIGPDAESIVLISATTRRGLDDSFAAMPVGRFRVKGKREEIDVFRLVCDLDAIASPQAS